MNLRWRPFLYCLSLLALAGCGGGPVPGHPPPFEASLPQPGVNDVWYSQESRDTVIVFIHGILSDSRSCWWYQDPLDRSHNNFWPEIVKRDTRLGSPSIFLAGYYADVDSGIATIRDSAQQVWRGLTRSTNGQKPIEAKRLLFITHSTGGIVARYLLEAYADQLRDKVVGLMLVASPSGGSEAANALAEIIEMYESELGRTLMTNSGILSDLDRRFKDLVANGTLPFLVGIEAIEHQRIFHRRYLPNWKAFEVTRLVPRESGGRYFGDARLLTRTDHFSTVKPQDERHPAHDLLLEFYEGRFAQASERARQVERPIVTATNVVEITAANAGEYQDIGKLTAHRLVVRDVDVKVRDTSEIEANEIELVGSARITGQEITVRAGRIKGGRIVADGSDGPPGQPGRAGGRIYVAAALSITGTTLLARGGKGGDAASGTAAGAPGGKGGTIHISSVNALDTPPDVNGGTGGQQAGKPGDPGSVFFTKFGNPLQARALAMTEGRAGLQGALIAAAVPVTGTAVTPLPFVRNDYAAGTLPDIDRLATILRNDSQATIVLQPGSDLPIAAAQKQYRITIELLQKRGVQRHQITTVEPNVAVVPTPSGTAAGIEAILLRPFKG